MLPSNHIWVSPSPLLIRLLQPAYRCDPQAIGWSIPLLVCVITDLLNYHTHPTGVRGSYFFQNLKVCSFTDRCRCVSRLENHWQKRSHDVGREWSQENEFLLIAAEQWVAKYKMQDAQKRVLHTDSQWPFQQESILKRWCVINFWLL